MNTIRYCIPINEQDGEDGSVTMDIVHLPVPKKARKKAWRKYLQIRLLTDDIHTLNKTTRAMGFTELL